MTSFLIVANAKPQKCANLAKLMQQKVTIAVDGAADLLRTNKLVPGYIVGDFDSITDRKYWQITDSINPYEGNFKVKIIPKTSQDITDLEQAIIHCQQQSEKGLILIVHAIDDDRLDHSLFNVRLLYKYHKANWKIQICTDSQILEYVTDATATITGEIGEHCAIMAFPKAKITTHGLKYDVKDHALCFASSESVANQLQEKKATVKVIGSALVIKPINEGLR